MLQARSDLDHVQEPFAAHRCREVGIEHLDGHGAVVLQVLGEPHGCHAAAADLALDSVTSSEVALEVFQGIGHLVMYGVGLPVLTGERSTPKVACSC